MLIVAGTDRLDRVMTVGQMQGKFQFVLLPQVCWKPSAPIWSSSLFAFRAASISFDLLCCLLLLLPFVLPPPSLFTFSYCLFLFSPFGLHLLFPYLLPSPMFAFKAA